MRTLLLAMLLINSFLDLTRREISLSMTGITGCIGLIVRLSGLWNGSADRISLYAFLPGMLLLVLAQALPDRIGAGDALTVLVLGTALSPERLLRLLFRSTAAAGVCGAILLLLRKDRQEELPFVPFLLVGYLFW